jgi:hypothetical protein
VSHQHGPSGPDPALYPDVAQAGDLRSALQSEFDAAGLASQAQHVSSPGWRYRAAELRSAERSVDVVMGIRERVFGLQFWARGVCMAHGNTDKLPAVAGAMHAWRSGMRVRHLISAWPFLSSNGFAEACERSDAEAIEYKWRQYHANNPQASQLTRLHPFIAQAFREPRLRALLPYTSHEALCFSRTVGYPYGNDCPLVVPLDDGRYLVKTADGRDLGTADAAGSVALVLTALDEQPTR